MKISKILSAVCFFAVISGLASAGPTLYDFGDAPAPYGVAKHNTGEWQYLGTAWDEEGSSKVVDLDGSDDGVSWSTDGTNFGYGSVNVGESVTFKFNMTRAGYGRHDYDQLKAWVDWNGDQVWDISEQIITEKWYKNTLEDGNTQILDSSFEAHVSQYGEVPNPTALLNKDFYATAIVPLDAQIGDTWLRARVSCTDDGALTPYNYMNQGEAEDYRVNVATVPAPSALLLGMFGAFGVRKFRRRLSA